MRIISLQLMQDARPLYGDSFINVETTHHNWELTLVGDVIHAVCPKRGLFIVPLSSCSWVHAEKPVEQPKRVRKVAKKVHIPTA